MNKKEVIHVHNRMLFSHEERGYSAIFDKTNEHIILSEMSD